MSPKNAYFFVGAVGTTAPPGDNCTPWETCRPS